MGDLVDATREALKAAKHLTATDQGMVAALLAVAQKIDTQDEYFKALEQRSVERRSSPPSMDNVSAPTYLKYCESLGLTPTSRMKLGLDKKDSAPAKSKLGNMRAIHGGKAS